MRFKEMNRKYSALLCIALLLCLCLTPSAMAATKEKKVATSINDASHIKDASQLQMEALEAELGEEGMKKVEDYLNLQASLPDVVKASPYSWIAFAATDKESQAAYMAAVDESNLGKEDKEN